MIKLSLVIPCYNEARGLPKLVDRCLELLQNEEIEVILVNNGSSDDSAEIFRDIAAKNYHRLKLVDVKVNQGYGHGILQGLKAAKGTYVGWTHADMQTDPLDSTRALKLIERSEQPIFVKGRRYGRPWTDVIFTVGMSVYESFLLKAPLWDINAQPTFFPRSFFEAWSEPPADFSLDLFAYISAKKVGLKIARFKVRFGKREFGTSSWNVDWASKKKFIKRTIQFSRELKKRA